MILPKTKAKNIVGRLKEVHLKQLILVYVNDVVEM